MIMPENLMATATALEILPFVHPSPSLYIVSHNTVTSFQHFLLQSRHGKLNTLRS